MGTLYEYQYTFLILSRSFLPRIKNVSNKCCRENQTTHFVCGNVYRISYRLGDNVEKLCLAVQATEDNMAHAHCMLDN